MAFVMPDVDGRPLGPILTNQSQFRRRATGQNYSTNRSSRGTLLLAQRTGVPGAPLSRYHNSTLLDKGYIYQLPSSESEKLGYYSLADRLDPSDGNEKTKKPAKVPVLGDRFKLAYRLAKAFNLLHPAVWLHKDFRSCNVVFFDKNGLQPNLETINVDDMYIVGFQYSRLGIAGEASIETQP